MVIETERLLLRRVTEDDLDALVRLHANPDVERFMDRFGHDEARAWLERQDRSWQERGHGRVAIIQRDSGQLIGRTGLGWLAGITGTAGLEETELGWTLARESWGFGYATEAAQAMADWAFHTLGVERIVSMIEEGNDRSVRVAKRLGMRPERAGVWYGRPMVVHAVTRHAFGLSIGQPGGSGVPRPSGKE